MSTGNSQTEPPLIASALCPKCKAANASHARQCWLCQSPLDPRESLNPYAATDPVRVVAVPVYSVAPSPAQARVEQVFLWLLVAIVVLAALVAAGLASQDSGLLTLYLMVMVPSLAAAGVRALYSVAKGETPQASKMFMTFVYSALLTFGLAALLVVCSVIFLFMMCFQMLNGLQHP